MQKRFAMVFMMVCFAMAGIFLDSATAYAKGITSTGQAGKMALEEVKKATVLEVDMDYEKGKLVYEVHLLKGTKEYEYGY